jgi:RND family efflux transporter MFP subunit
VITTAVEIDPNNAEVRAIGTITAAQEITIYAQVTGLVSEIDFKPGSHVDAGQLLVRLDDSDQTVAVEKAQVTLDTATEARARAEALAKSNNVTKAALSDAVAAEHQAEIDLRSTQLELAKRSIKAPFAGTISLTELSVGDLVTTSKPIAVLSDTSTVTVAFTVPERVAGQLKLGQKVEVTTDALPGKVTDGTISAIDNRIDPTGRTLKAEAGLANDGGALKSGMGVTVAIEFPPDPRPSVPSLALQWDRTGSFVWKIDGDVAHRVPVQIIARRSGTVVVAADLKAGDQVVTEGVLRLRDGIKVTRLNGDDQAAPAAPAAAPAATPGPEAEADTAARPTASVATGVSRQN